MHFVEYSGELHPKDNWRHGSGTGHRIHRVNRPELDSSEITATWQICLKRQSQDSPALSRQHSTSKPIKDGRVAWSQNKNTHPADWLDYASSSATGVRATHLTTATHLKNRHNQPIITCEGSRHWSAPSRLDWTTVPDCSQGKLI